MKKFKSILCGAFAFVAGSVALSACGAKTEPNETPSQQQEQQQEITVGTKTTISLAEAKRIIVNALAIDNNQLQTQSTRDMVLHAADASEGNRNIFEKMGRFSSDEHLIETIVSTNEKKYERYKHLDALYHETFQNYLINVSGSENKEGYYIDGKYYDKSNGVQDYKIENDIVFYQALFNDEAFDRVYDDEAIKETNKNGYSITLTGDLKSYMFYSYTLFGNSDFEEYWEDYLEKMKDCPNEYLNKCYFNVTVNIDGNNDVISAVVDFTYVHYLLGEDDKTIEDYFIQDTLITFTKTNKPIIEPDWVTEYKQAHA